MPSDPEHHLDKPLRAYARKRRQDAGEPALHPATRRLLQSEAARLRSQPGPGRARWSWAAWPRLAFAAAISVLLGVLLWNVLPDRQQGTPSTLALMKQRPADVEKAGRSSEEKKPGLRADNFAGLGRSNKDENLKEKSAQPNPRFREWEDRMEVTELATRDVRLTRTLAESALAAQPAPASPRGAAPEAKRGETVIAEEALIAQSKFNQPQNVDAMKRSEFDAYGVTLVPKASASQPFFGGAKLQDSSNGKPTALLADGVTAATELYYRESAPPGAPPAASPTLPLASPAAVPPATVPPSAPMLGAEPQMRARSFATPAPQRALAPTAGIAQLKSLPGALTLTQTQQRLRYQRSEPAGATIAARRYSLVTPLALFDFEQSGQRVRLIDADGSVYEGSTSTTNPSAFRVFGTNRANGKPLTVDGEFVSESAVSGAANGVVNLFGESSRGRAPRPAAPAAPAALGAGGPATAVAVESPRALYLNIRPEGVAEMRSLAVPAAK